MTSICFLWVGSFISAAALRHSRSDNSANVRQLVACCSHPSLSRRADDLRGHLAAVFGLCAIVVQLTHGTTTIYHHIATKRPLVRLGVVGALCARRTLQQGINHRASCSLSTVPRSAKGFLFRYAIIWRVNRDAPLPWRNSHSERVANASILHPVILNRSCRFDNETRNQI
jgi:hypothetical protein